MKIAIHPNKTTFSSRWIEYCEENNGEYIIVNCYDRDVRKQLEDCHILLWPQNQVEDFFFAKQLLFSLEVSGKKVFPDFKTGWHFDDKVGQKYLLEATKAPFVPSFCFYNKNVALKWAEETNYPKVFLTELCNDSMGYNWTDIETVFNPSSYDATISFTPLLGILARNSVIKQVKENLIEMARN